MSPSGGGTITPSTGFFDPGNVVVTATPAADYLFSGFSGALMGPTNPQTLNLTAASTVTANFVVDPATIPTAAATAANVTAPGSTTHAITVTYADNSGIDAATIGVSDVTVSGPGGYLATPVSVNVVGSNPAIATYSVVPPGGAWDVADAGTYTINMIANQVLDVSGNAVLPGPIGSFDAFPSVPITVTTNPAGLGLIVDGVGYTSPQTFQWLVSSTHTIHATTPQSAGPGTQQAFESWSDLGLVNHDITVSAPATFTAQFGTQYLLTTAANPVDGGSLSPASGYFDAGNVSISATPNAGFIFTGFDGAVTGTTSSQTLNLSAPSTVVANFQRLRYVGRVVSATTTTASTSKVLTAGRAVSAGDGVLVAVLLSSTGSGTVSVTDAAGNVYTMDRDQTDGGAGDRTLVFSSLNARALGIGSAITLTYPRSAECQVTVDEFSGLVARDRAASAYATGTSFNSGLTAATTEASELLYGVDGEESGNVPVFATGWTGLPTVSIGSDRLTSAFRLVTATGAYNTAGTGGGTWMAAIVTYTTGAVVAPTDHAPVVVVAPTATVNENQQLSLTVTASDADAQAITTLTADLSNLPPGNSAVFTPNANRTAGTLTWTPTFNDGRVAAYNVSFAATNTLSGSAQSAITVTNVDRAPVVTAPATLTVTAGVPLTVNVTAADPDGDAIASLTANLAGLPVVNNAVFTPNVTRSAGALTWTPQVSDVRTAPYTVTFTAANAQASLPTSTAFTVVSTTAAAPGYVGRVVSGTTTSASTSKVLKAGRAVSAGEGILVAVLLSSTGSGTVSVGDAAGNVYTLDRDQTNGGGDRTLVFSSLKVRALASGSTITLTYPRSAECQVSLDEFSGLVARDRATSAFATSTSFNSGATSVTTQASELLYGAVGEESGNVPAWAAGWAALPTVSISTDRLTAAYRVVNATGAYNASGTGSGTWMTAIVTYSLPPGSPAQPAEPAVATSDAGPDAAYARPESYPNPARGSVTLALTLKDPGPLRIGLFDLNGRRVRSVADEAQSAAGTHRFTLGGRGSNALPAGIYFYRVEIPDGTYTGRLVIINQ